MSIQSVILYLRVSTYCSYSIIVIQANMGILGSRIWSAAHRNYLASLARGNIVFVQVVLFPKP